MKTKKIRYWARLGQIAFFMFQIFAAALRSEMTTYNPSQFSGTVAETVYAIIGFIFLIIFSEAIVRLIIYFSELLER